MERRKIGRHCVIAALFAAKIPPPTPRDRTNAQKSRVVGRVSDASVAGDASCDRSFVDRLISDVGDARWNAPGRPGRSARPWDDSVCRSKRARSAGVDPPPRGFWGPILARWNARARNPARFWHGGTLAGPTTLDFRAFHRPNDVGRTIFATNYAARMQSSPIPGRSFGPRASRARSWHVRPLGRPRWPFLRMSDRVAALSRRSPARAAVQSMKVMAHSRSGPLKPFHNSSLKPRPSSPSLRKST